MLFKIMSLIPQINLDLVWIILKKEPRNFKGINKTILAKWFTKYFCSQFKYFHPFKSLYGEFMLKIYITFFNITWENQYLS